MSTFSNLLKAARIRAGLTQGALCTAAKAAAKQGGEKDLKFSQPLYSAWETGAQIPSSSQEASVRALSEVLSLPEDELIEAWHSSRYSPREGGLNEQRYLSQVERLLDSPCRYELWLLLPNPLSATSSEHLRALWAKHVARGLNCRLVWSFQGMTPEEKDNAIAASDMFCDLEEEIQTCARDGETEPGNIWNIAADVDRDSRGLLMTLDAEAKALAARSPGEGASGGPSYRGWGEIDGESGFDLRSMSQLALEGSTVVYVPDDRSIRLLKAGMALDKVCFSPADDEEEVRMFLWFGLERRNRLCEHVHNIWDRGVTINGKRRSIAPHSYMQEME